MSGVKNNVGRGINIALANGNDISCTVCTILSTTVYTAVTLATCPPPGKTGDVIKTDYFDMWAGGECSSQPPNLKYCIQNLYFG